MRILLLVCPCPRHHYAANTLIGTVPVVGIVRQYRAPRAASWGEVSPAELAAHEAFLAARRACEQQMLGDSMESLRVPEGVPVFDEHGETLSSRALSDFIRRLAPTAIVNLGCRQIAKPLRRRATYGLSLHLGLTPRYRGAGGLFWPIYNMDPERIGASVITLDDDIDTGDIAHHSRPNIEAGDTIHTLACKSLLAGIRDLTRIVMRLKESSPLYTVPPVGSGRVYYEAAYHPRHLFVIDKVMQAGLLQAYLDDKEFRDEQVTRVCYPGLD